MKSLNFHGMLKQMPRIEGLDQALKEIQIQAKQWLGVDHLSIFLHDSSKENGLRRVFTTIPEENQIKPRVGGNAWQVFINNKPMILTRQELEKIHPGANEQVQSVIIVPLSKSNEPVGILTLHSPRDLLHGEDDITKIEQFGMVVGSMIALAQAYDAVKVSLEQRDMFISYASHELKNPLATIMAYSELALKRMDNGREIKRKDIEAIRRAGKRIDRMINIFLGVENIRSGKIHFDMKKVKLEQIVNRAIDEFLSIYNKHSISFQDDANGQAVVWGDRNWLQQSLVNLLNNAGKYSDEGTSVLVALRQEKESYVLGVRDQGDGIGSNEIENVFGLFKRGRNPRAKGLGLGLYLVSEVVKKHGGEIRVKSRLGQGSLFEIYLPRYELGED